MNMQDRKIYQKVERMDRMLTVIMRKLEIAENERKELQDAYNALSARLIELDCDRIIDKMEAQVETEEKKETKPKRKRAKKDETDT